MGNIARMNEEQFAEARRLIKKRCCNYDRGSCLVLSWPFCDICPQCISYSVLCKWFRDAVLPGSEELERSIFGDDAVIHRCVVCKCGITPTGPRSKYCPECAQKIRRKKQAEWARKKRADASTF